MRIWCFTRSVLYWRLGGRIQRSNQKLEGKKMETWRENVGRWHKFTWRCLVYSLDLDPFNFDLSLLNLNDQDLKNQILWLDLDRDSSSHGVCMNYEYIASQVCIYIFSWLLTYVLRYTDHQHNYCQNFGFPPVLSQTILFYWLTLIKQNVIKNESH